MDAVDTKASHNIDKIGQQRKPSHWETIRSRMGKKSSNNPNRSSSTVGTEDSSMGFSLESSNDKPRRSIIAECIPESCCATHRTQPQSESSEEGASCLKVRTQAESIALQLSVESSEESTDRRATFTTIEVHTHEVTLGDNPSVSVGPPLTIGWKAVDSIMLQLDEYEEARASRREKVNLIVPKSTRIDWLRDAGYARSELKAVEDDIAFIKKYRKKNAQPSLWERMTRPTKGVIVLGSS
jgi:hypothetical protein